MTERKIKVHLVFAPSLIESPYQVLGESVWPPLGVLYLASYLRAKTNDVEISVTDGCRIGYERTVAQIGQSQADIVGISFFTTMAHGAAQVAREARRLLPGALIVAGGPHATALPEDTLEKTGADIVVLGEGEEVFRQVVEWRRRGAPRDEVAKLPGVCLRWNGKVHKNSPPPFLTPLDDIPFPARDLIDVGKYTGFYLAKQKPEMSMVFSRGCPYNCTFCSNCVWKSSKPVVRFRSAENIADEMEYLHTTFSSPHIA